MNTFFARALSCLVRRATSFVSNRVNGSRPCALAWAAAALVVCAGPHQALAQALFASGGSSGSPTIHIQNDGSGIASGSSTLTVSGLPAGTTVNTISVTLHQVNADGTSNNGISCSAFVLESPGGTKFEFLGDTGANDTLSNATIVVEDTAPATAPVAGGSPSDWSSTGGTVKPSSYWTGNQGNCSLQSVPSPVSGDLLPQTDGSATLNGTFGGTTGATANGTWTLFVYTDDPFLLSDPISVTNWWLTMTFNASTSDPTATALSNDIGGNSNLGATGSPITYTATVTDTPNPGTTVSNGAVAFTANGATIAGCGGVPVSGGTATCSTTFSTQGLYSIVASYTPGTGFTSSTSTTLDQLVESATTGSTGTNTWCNSGSVTIPGTTTGVAYPSVIKVSGYPGGTTVANVEVQLNNVTGSVAAQHLLVAPDGTHNLDFFDSSFNQNDLSSGVNLNFLDAAGQYPNNNNAPASGNYAASDEATTTDTFPSSSAPSLDTVIPQVPGAVNYGYDPFSIGAHGTIGATFESNFNGAPANGTWALYPYSGLSLPQNETIAGGWCVVFTLNSGLATTTTVTSNKNPQVAQTPVALTAAVKAGGNPVTNGGTVTFLENHAVPSGITSPNNVVNLDTTTGLAKLTTGTVSSSIDIGNSQTMTIYEGDYDMSADYSGVVNQDAISSGSLWQRFDDATTFSSGPGGSINACNTGPVLLDAVNNIGAFQPNPSNIFVAGLPGTVSAVSLSLNGFYTSNAGAIDQTETLLAGPGGALDFFSNTGSASTQLGSTTSPYGTLTFSDAAPSIVTASGSTFTSNTNKPTAVGTSADTFTSSSSGLYNVPGSFVYAEPRGAGTFSSVFGGSNPNGTWSLFFNATNHLPAEGAQNGWCLNFTENPVTATVDESHSGTGAGGDFIQGETGAQITTVVTNNGNGPTGDPLGTNPLTVTDTLNSNLTYVSDAGSDPSWSCSASGQTVTCTNDSAVAQGSAYPTLTLNVNVSAGFSGNANNSVSVSGAGITSTSSNTDIIAVEGSASLSIAKSHTGTFTQGSTGVWTLVVANNAASGGTSGTVTVSDTLPIGYTLASATSTGSLFACSGTGITVTCTGTPGIAAGGSNTITLTVNVPASSPVSVSNTASVWGGGDPVHTSAGTAALSNTDTATVTQVPASVKILAGNTQSATAGTPFASPLTIQVEDAATNPIPGASVTFTAPGSGPSGTFANSTTTITGITDGSGLLVEPFTANAVAGAYLVTAQAGSASNSFSLTNTAGAAANFILTGGNSQSAYVQTGFGVPLAVQVTDLYGNPISGLMIAFSAPGSGASASLSNSGSCITAANGACSVTATANGTAGSYNVMAAVSGVGGLGTLSFALTNNPPPSYVVNTTADDASGVAANCPIGGAATPACTLRDALAAAASAGTGNVTFSSTVFNTAQTITLTNGALTVPTNTAITGPGASLLTVSGNSASRVFSVGSGVTASISAMTIANGVDTSGSGGGGGIYNGGTLSLSSCAVTSNQQTNSGAGGGIYNASGASLTMIQCTVSNNTGAGNVGQGGGLDNDGTATVADSTFSANTAAGGAIGGGDGGAIDNGNGGTLTLIDSTLTGNQVTDPGGPGGLGADGGAIYNLGVLVAEDSTIAGNSQTGSGGGGGIVTFSGTGRSCTLSNTILAGNTDAGGYPDGAGQFTDGGHNLIGNGTGISGISNGANSDQIGTSGSPINAMLSPLGNHGGPTQTMIPLPGSAAICAGSSSLVPGGTTTDQRGDAIGAGGYCPAGSLDAGAVQTDYSIKFNQQPSTVVQNIAMAPAPTVELDENGKAFADGTDTVTIPLTLTTGSGTLSGGSAATSTTTGIATYPALSISLPGTNDQLTASLALNPAITPTAPTLSVLSSAFNVNSAVTQLAFSPAPASTVTAGGNAGASIVVHEEDVSGALVTTAGDTITLTVTGPNSYTKTYTQTAASGVATFNLSGATLTAGGAYSYTASISSAPSITDATANETVNAAAAASVNVVSGSGQSAVIGTAFAQPLTVKVEDQYNNVVPNVMVLFTAPASGASATLSTPGTTDTNGATSVTATANGVAGATAYSVTASIGGATPATFMLTNSKHSTSLTVAPSSASLVYGQPVTVKASIAPASVLSSAPTGTVTFYDGATALTPNATVSGAAASYAVSVPTVGNHTYAATYLGDGNFSASVQTSATTTLIVGKASSTLTGPVSPVSFTYGTGGTISINVAGQYSGTGIATPGGTVSYTIGSGAAQTAAIAAGAATLTIPSTQAAGSYTVAIGYSGDGNYNAATKLTVQLTIRQAAAVIHVTPYSVTYDATAHTATGTATGAGGVNLAADLTLTGTTHTAAGTYATDAWTFHDPNGNYANASGTVSDSIGVATLTIVAHNATRIYGTSNPTFSGSVTGQQGADTFAESFTTSATLSSPVGAYAIVPSVTGTNLADYTQAVTNGTLSITQAASITTLKSSSGSTTPGQVVTFTAAVASATTGTPTGTVNFYDRTTPLGSANLIAGAAALSTTALAPGITHVITAAYSGDVNFIASTSGSTAAAIVTVAPLDFTMDLNGPANLTVVPGQSISYQVKVTPDYGSYAGPVTFAMTGLPAGDTVTFSPASIAANGGPQTVTITIHTAPVTAALPLDRRPPEPGRKAAPFALAFLVLVGAGSLRKRGSALRRLLCLLVLAGGGLLALGVSGCAGHPGFFAQAPQTYTLTVTATSANLQHSTTVNLNVQ